MKVSIFDYMAAMECAGRSQLRSLKHTIATILSGHDGL